MTNEEIIENLKDLSRRYENAIHNYYGEAKVNMYRDEGEALNEAIEKLSKMTEGTEMRLTADISENPKLTLSECIIMAMSKITADLSEAAEKNWTEPQCEMLTRLICSVFMDKPYDEVTEEDMKSILEEQDE